VYKLRTFPPSFGCGFQHSSTPPYKHSVTSLITNIRVVACIPIHTTADLQQFYFPIFNFSAVVTCAFTAPIFFLLQYYLQRYTIHYITYTTRTTYNTVLYYVFFPFCTHGMKKEKGREETIYYICSLGTLRYYI